MEEAEALACRLLLLEQKLESYARLHAQELAELRQMLQELKAALCAWHQRQTTSFVTALDRDNTPR